MPHTTAATAALSALLSLAPLAQAWTLQFQDHLSYPGAPRPAEKENNGPHAMTYTDEVARSLGMKDGHMDFFLFQPRSNYLPR